jgi:4-hydroxybenzoate polyprenyltransferase
MPTSVPPAPAGRAGPRLQVTAAFRLLRPHQWTKNLLCFLPGFCAGVSLDRSRLAAALLTFAAFCLGSSFAYILNDLQDIEGDRAHARKRHRPLAAGTLSRIQAIGVAVVMLALAVGAASLVSTTVLALLLGYMILNVAYSFRLKHFAILDVMLISGGFLLRLIAGGQASGVSVSAWLTLCAFFLSLFLAFSKRRAELNGPDPGRSREVLGQYTKLMLDRFSNISATLAIATYAVFTVVARPDHALLLTCPPVIFGMFRYLLLIETQNVGETPELVLLKDVPILAALLIWAATYAAVLDFGLRVGFL